MFNKLLVCENFAHAHKHHNHKKLIYMLSILEFCTYGYGQRPKFAMAEHSATAKGEKCCYGPTLMQTPENVSLQLQGPPVICYLIRAAVRNGKKNQGEKLVCGIGNI